MKKGLGIVSALCFAVAFCIALAGCGAGVDKSLYTGNWELASSTSSELDEDMLQLMASMDMQVTMTLNADGTGRMDMVGVTTDMTWEAKSNTEATGTMDGAEITMTLEDDKLTLHDESDITMTFVREGSEEAAIRASYSSEAPQGSQESASSEAAGSEASSERSASAE